VIRTISIGIIALAAGAVIGWQLAPRKTVQEFPLGYIGSTLLADRDCGIWISGSVDAEIVVSGVTILNSPVGLCMGDFPRVEGETNKILIKGGLQ